MRILNWRYGVLQGSSLERSNPILEKRQVEPIVYRSIQDFGEDWIGNLSIRVTIRLGMDSRCVSCLYAEKIYF